MPNLQVRIKSKSPAVNKNVQPSAPKRNAKNVSNASVPRISEIRKGPSFNRNTDY